jgi:hypothetical protein
MKIEPEILKYLKGEAFDTSLSAVIGKTKHKIISREAAVTGIIRDKDVIHIGCADHIQIINEKIKNNIWLHKLITDNARNCVGIDIDRESIDYIRKELGFTNVHYGDILSETHPEIAGKRWDYVVFGEIIEHLDNPVNFLKIFKERYGGITEKFIVTVPGIYNRSQFRNMMNFREVINSDHRFWFTPYTISKILVSAGYCPDNIIYANLQKLTYPELVIRKIRRIAGLDVKYPFYYFKTLIVTGNLNC